MGCYGAVLKGVIRRELVCKQCGDKFEHFCRNAAQREFCDYCHHKRLNEGVRRRKANVEVEKLKKIARGIK